MSAAAYNRGSRVVAREVDSLAQTGAARTARAAEAEQTAHLRDRIRSLERDLGRARRCIAELRRSKEARISEAREALARSDSAIRMLTRIAFPADHAEIPKAAVLP